MKEKDEMFSVGEILKSKEFKKQVPKEFSFQIRKFRRDYSQTTELPSRKENQSIKDIDRRRYR